MMPTISFNIERWKWSEEYRVYVSTEGRLRKKDGTDIRLKIDKKGYMILSNKKEIIRVHRVVMKTWKPCENMDNLTVDHLDHNKRKNSLSNLEWVSKEENQRRASEDYYSPKEDKKNKQSNLEWVSKEENQRRAQKDYYSPKGEKKIEKYYVEGVEFSRAQMKILFTEAVFEKLKHKQKRNYCGKNVEVRYEYI